MLVGWHGALGVGFYVMIVRSSCSWLSELGRLPWRRPVFLVSSVPLA